MKTKEDKTYQNRMLIEQKVNIHYIIDNFKNPLVSREQLNLKTGETK